MINSTNLPSIRIITNKLEGEKTREMDKMKPLFESLSKSGIGKYTNSHYICESELELHERTEIDILFNILQRDNQRSGFKYSMYCWDI